jgi:hypothetical protein
MAQTFTILVNDFRDPQGNPSPRLHVAPSCVGKLREIFKPLGIDLEPDGQAGPNLVKLKPVAVQERR